MGYTMKVAAIVYPAKGSEAIDQMLDVLAGDLKSGGYRVAGAVQHNTPSTSGECSNMALEDLTSGRSFDISVCGGSKAGGCTLNPDALEDVAGLVAANLGRGADVLILNRFGKQEVGGHGFRAVIEAAVLDDVPVLVALNAAHRSSWREFTGDCAVELSPDLGSLKSWFRSVVPQASKATANVQTDALTGAGAA
jgi:nucleoside-triphosphatase THEP1